MAIETLNISLTDAMKATVVELAETEGYGDTSEFFRDLVRRHIEARRQLELEDALLQGIESGEARPYSRQALEEMTKTIIFRNHDRE